MVRAFYFVAFLGVLCGFARPPYLALLPALRDHPYFGFAVGEEWCDGLGMDELVKMIQSRVGLTEEQARQAAETAIEFVKAKLPAGLEQHVDGFLTGKSIPSAMELMSSLLGGRK